jgi:hypothetical protein
MICFFRPYNLVERENVTLAISQKFAQYEDYAYLRVGKGRNFLANFGEMEVFFSEFWREFGENEYANISQEKI